MAILERNYTIPLRKDFWKVPKYYRAKRAVNFIKAFIKRHMKAEDIKIGGMLNNKIWEHGIKNPPGKVKVKAIKDGNTITVELEGFEYKVEKVQTQKSEEPKTLKDKISSAMSQDKKAEAKEDTEAPKKTKQDDESKPAEKPKTARKAKPEPKKQVKKE